MVTGNVMRVVIEALQQVAGRNCVSLLTAAGLSRYNHRLPPDDWQPAASGEELVRLYLTIYEMLGEPITRLFHRNCGEVYVRSLAQSKWTQELSDRGRAVPAEERLEWFVREMAQMAARGWSPQTISEDATAWYLTAEFCPICVGLHGVSAPICAQAPTMFSGLAKDLIGRRVRVVEVECVAMGAAHCKVAFYK
jgi:predicted hydrocarbon binding protein